VSSSDAEKSLYDAVVARAFEEWHLAADLYQQVASLKRARAAKRAGGTARDPGFLYEVLAAYCSVRNARNTAPAEAVLSRVLEYDWREFGRSFAPLELEPIFVHFLLKKALAGDHAGYKKQLEQSIKKFAKYRHRFVRTRAEQAKLLVACSALDWDEECAWLLKQIDDRYFRPHIEMRVLIKRLRADLDIPYQAPEFDDPDQAPV
jgi:hypothetical protein